MEEFIIVALQASHRNASALSLLARIEFLLAEGLGVFEQCEIGNLIDEWAAEIGGVDSCEIERLKRRLAHFGNLP